MDPDGSGAAGAARNRRCSRPVAVHQSRPTANGQLQDCNRAPFQPPASRRSSLTPQRPPLANVSQSLGFPFCNPLLNQLTLCADVPCVNVSASTCPVVCCSIRSSPTAAAAFNPDS